MSVRGGAGSDNAAMADLTRAAINAIQPIIRDLRDRTGDAIPEDQWNAVHAAIINATMAGVRVGAAELAAHAIEQGVDVHLDFDAEPVTPEDLDAWLSE